MIFDDVIEYLDDFERVLNDAFQKAINIHSDRLKDYIIETQLYNQGIDGDNKKLKGYSRGTIRIKIMKKQPYDRTTLKDTGKFYQSIVISGNPTYFVVESNIEYAKWLTKRYGKKILHISNENIQRFINEYVSEIIKNIRT